MHICEYCGESVLDAFLSVSDMPTYSKDLVN